MKRKIDYTELDNYIINKYLEKPSSKGSDVAKKIISKIYSTDNLNVVDSIIDKLYSEATRELNENPSGYGTSYIKEIIDNLYKYNTENYVDKIFREGKNDKLYIEKIIDRKLDYKHTRINLLKNETEDMFYKMNNLDTIHDEDIDSDIETMKYINSTFSDVITRGL